MSLVHVRYGDIKTMRVCVHTMCINLFYYSNTHSGRCNLPIQFTALSELTKDALLRIDPIHICTYVGVIT